MHTDVPSDHRTPIKQCESFDKLQFDTKPWIMTQLELLNIKGVLLQILRG